MKVLIFDNDVNSEILVNSHLSKISFVSEVQTAYSQLEALNLILTYKPEVVLLSMELQNESFFDFLETVKPINFKLIFLAERKNYAFRAIKANAHDYLLKPVKFLELNKIFAKLSVNKSFDVNARVVIKTLQTKFVIRLLDIIKITSARSYCTYYLTDGRDIIASHNLKTANERLPKKIFFRTHHSHIVNLRFVKRIDIENGLEIILKDNSSIPLARRRKVEFLSAIADC